MIRIEHNAETGEITEIELTAAEIKEIEKAAAQRNALENDQNDAKAALLEKLGITSDEAKLLLS